MATKEGLVEMIAGGPEGLARVEAFKKRVSDSLKPGELEKLEEQVMDHFRLTALAKTPWRGVQPQPEPTDTMHIQIVNEADRLIQAIAKDGDDHYTKLAEKVLEKYPSLHQVTRESMTKAVVQVEKMSYATLILAEKYRR